MMSIETRYTTDDLKAMPVISEGWTANLHIDTGTERVWLERIDRTDGATFDNEVTHERLVAGRWITALVYNGDNVDEVAR